MPCKFGMLNLDNNESECFDFKRANASPLVFDPTHSLRIFEKCLRYNFSADFVVRMIF